MQYLITNLRTGIDTWEVEAKTIRAARIAHENEWQLFPATIRFVIVRSQGSKIDAVLGESACRGLRENVVRSHAGA